MSAKWLVIGDEFKHFGSLDNVLLFTPFMEIVQSGDPLRKLSGAHVVIGQGMSDDEIALVTDASAACNFRVYMVPDRRVQSTYSHKRKVENSLISDPRRLSENVFACAMLVDDCCAEMSDHLTGYHVQGMVLIEAARQMFISVTEKFEIPEEKLGGTYYIFDSISIRFLSFMFPVAVTIRYEIVSRMINGNRRSYVVSLNFEQVGGERCASADIEFSVFPKLQAERVEKKKANDVVKKCFSQFPHNDMAGDEHVEEQIA